jgi:hypothetical protein
VIVMDRARFPRDKVWAGWVTPAVLEALELAPAEYLNVGFGRRGAAHFDAHVRAFIEFLTRSGRAPASTLDIKRWGGHAYRLAGTGRPVCADGLVPIGDSAGLAYPESGEGIGPAVRSAIAAANTILATRGAFDLSRLTPYVDFGRATAPASGFLSWLQSLVPAAIGRTLPNSPRFVRLALDRWFLRTA